MAGRTICLLIYLTPSPRLELRTLAGYSTYNVTMCRVRATNAAVEKQELLHNLSVYLQP
jgi:hypothetical protein